MSDFNDYENEFLDELFSNPSQDRQKDWFDCDSDREFHRKLLKTLWIQDFANNFFDDFLKFF